MHFSRRRLLGTGVVAVAAGMVPSAKAMSSETIDRQTSTSQALPKEGHLYYGASLPPSRSISQWEADLGARLAVHRSFFRRDGAAPLVAQSGDDLKMGRLPHVSIKPKGTWADIASGRRDQWLDGMIDGLAALDGPVFLTVHHEPENDAGADGMRAGDFVAMQQRVIKRAGQAAPNVTVVPVLMHWTFEPGRGDKDPKGWVVPEAQVFGLDLYNPWSPGNGKEWRSFGSKLEDVLPWADSRPIAIGEYGCHNDPSQPGRAADWMRAAFTYAREHNVVSMAYFNSALNSERTWKLDGQREKAFASALKSSWVVRPKSVKNSGASKVRC